MLRTALLIVLPWGLIVLGPTACDQAVGTTPHSGDSGIVKPMYNGGSPIDRRNP